MKAHFNPVLTEIEIEKLASDRTISTSELFEPNDYYGHASILKRYCGLDQSHALPGIIPHAPTFDDFVWESEINHPLPSIFLYSSFEKEVYSTKTNKHLLVIGAPFYYAYEIIKATAKKIQRTAFGTIVFPGHSTHHILVQFDQKALIDYLKNLPPEYHPITICLGWREIQLGKHYDYFREGFNCTTAGHMYDKEFVFRLIKIIISHKYSITNKFSTSSFYSAALGLPVILFRQQIDKIEAREGQPSYLLDETVQRPFLYQTKKFLKTFDLPICDRSLLQLELAKSILGINSVLSSFELKNVINSLEEKKRTCIQMIHNDFLAQGSFDEVLCKTENILREFPRRTPGKVKIKDRPIIFADLHSFYHQSQQIFKSHLYDFSTDTDNPVIIDCGAHIGLASIYFAEKYPKGKIYAYEADPAIGKMLNVNIKSLGLKNVETCAHAVWIDDNGVLFKNTNDDSGFINNFRHKNCVRIPSVRLKDILENKKIDLLKLDIEGSEYEVIADCDNVLNNVKNIIVEVHKFRDHNGSLGDILGILEKNHFEYTFGDLHLAEWLEPSLIPPFSACSTNKYTITIFAWQPKNNRLNKVKTHKHAKKAISELNSGENSKAILLIKEAIQESPEEKALNYALAVAYAREDNFFEAKKLLAQIPESNHIYDKASYLLEVINNEIKDKHEGE
jgi:FkbM family methyltransferase